MSRLTEVCAVGTPEKPPRPVTVDDGRVGSHVAGREDGHCGADVGEDIRFLTGAHFRARDTASA